MSGENKPNLQPVESKQSNVIDFQTRQSLLPSQVRAAIIGQYAESQALEDDPSTFATKLEKRLFTDLAYAGAKMVKEAIDNAFGGEDE